MAGRNVEAHEHRVDAEWRMGDRIHQADLWDSVQDARSEARYEDDPSAEPEELDTREPYDSYIVDDTAGFRG